MALLVIMKDAPTKKSTGECVGCIGQVALSNQFTAFQTSQKGVLILIVADSLVICKEDDDTYDMFSYV